jgi:hypothetical protein
MTLFVIIDMLSGGRRKTAVDAWFVRADTEGQARERFTDHTGRDPDHITCECCGPDFVVREHAAGAWYGQPGDPGTAEVPS